MSKKQPSTSSHLNVQAEKLTDRSKSSTTNIFAVFDSVLKTPTSTPVRKVIKPSFVVKKKLILKKQPLKTALKINNPPVSSEKKSALAQEVPDEAVSLESLPKLGESKTTEKNEIPKSIEAKVSDHKEKETAEPNENRCEEADAEASHSEKLDTVEDAQAAAESSEELITIRLNHKVIKTEKTGEIVLDELNFDEEELRMLNNTEFTEVVAAEKDEESVKKQEEISTAELKVADSVKGEKEASSANVSDMDLVNADSGGEQNSGKTVRCKKSKSSKSNNSKKLIKSENNQELIKLEKNLKVEQQVDSCALQPKTNSKATNGVEEGSNKKDKHHEVKLQGSQGSQERLDETKEVSQDDDNLVQTQYSQEAMDVSQEDVSTIASQISKDDLSTIASMQFQDDLSTIESQQSQEDLSTIESQQSQDKTVFESQESSDTIRAPNSEEISDAVNALSSQETTEDGPDELQAAADDEDSSSTNGGLTEEDFYLVNELINSSQDDCSSSNQNEPAATDSENTCQNEPVATESKNKNFIVISDDEQPNEETPAETYGGQQQPHPILTAEELALMNPIPSSDDENPNHFSEDEFENHLVIDETRKESPVAERAKTPVKEAPKKQDYRSKFKIKKKNPADKPAKKASAKSAPKIQPKNKMINEDRPPLLDSPAPASKPAPVSKPASHAANKIPPRQSEFHPKPTSQPAIIPFNTFQAQGPSQFPPYYQNGPYHHQGPPQFNPPPPMYGQQPPVFNHQPPPMYHMSQPPNMMDPSPFYHMPGSYPVPQEQPQFFNGNFGSEIPVAGGQHSTDPRKPPNQPTDPRQPPSVNPRGSRKAVEAGPSKSVATTSGKVLKRPPLKNPPPRIKQPAKAKADSMKIKFRCPEKLSLPDISEKLRRREPLTRKEEDHVKDNQKFFKDVKRIKNKFDFKVVSNLF